MAQTLGNMGLEKFASSGQTNGSIFWGEEGGVKSNMCRLMYIENKSSGNGLDGPARIGWVTFSKSKRSYHYNGRTLKRVGDGYKYNCIDEESGDEIWISGPKVKGGDKLYGGLVEIDEDAREEYWINIRKQPGRKSEKSYRG
jgi:hypothetical protein